jgi:hypothetical protein
MTIVGIKVAEGARDGKKVGPGVAEGKELGS